MRAWLLGVLVILCFWLETAALSRVRLLGVHPELVLTLTTVFGFFSGPWPGALLGFAGGLFTDLFGGQLIGLGAAAQAGAGYVGGLLGQRLFRENRLIIAGAAGLAVGVYQIVYACGALAFGYPVAIGGGLWRIVLPSALYSALWSFPVGWVLLWIDRRIDRDFLPDAPAR